MTPIKNLDYKIDGGEIVTILLPRFKNKIISQRLKNPFVNIKLDQIGSSVWLEIDGKKNVENIIKILDEKFGPKIQPSTERVIKFLTQLHNQDFIKFKEI